MTIPKKSITVIVPIYTPIIPMIFPLYHCNPENSTIVIVSMYIPIISIISPLYFKYIPMEITNQVYYINDIPRCWYSRSRFVNRYWYDSMYCLNVKFLLW